MDVKQVFAGILTFRGPETLARALDAYRTSGLLEMFGACCVWLNEAREPETQVCKDYGVEYVESSVNVGIGKAWAGLAQQASRRGFEYFATLEHDFWPVEDRDTCLRRINDALYLLEAEAVDFVRLRHRKTPGNPHYPGCYKGQEGSMPQPLRADVIHWGDPVLLFPGRFQKIQAPSGEEWFTCDSSDATFTNNPVIYKTAFFQKAVSPLCTGSGVALEGDMNSDEAWYGCGYRGAVGEGLFRHGWA